MAEFNSEDLRNMIIDRAMAETPNWFNKYEAKILDKAFFEGELDTEIEEIISLVEEKLQPFLKSRVDNIFCGERIRTIGQEDIGDKALKILKRAVVSLQADNKIAYKIKQDGIKRLTRMLELAEAELKKMPKPQTRKIVLGGK